MAGLDTQQAALQSRLDEVTDELARAAELTGRLEPEKAQLEQQLADLSDFREWQAIPADTRSAALAAATPATRAPALPAGVIAP